MDTQDYALLTLSHIYFLCFHLLAFVKNIGIEELSIQLEEPFSLLPLHKIAEGIGKSADEHFDWNETDERRRADANNYRPMSNKMEIDSSRQETEKQTYTPPAATQAEAQMNQAAHSYESLAESWKMMNGDH